MRLTYEVTVRRRTKSTARPERAALIAWRSLTAPCVVLARKGKPRKHYDSIEAFGRDYDIVQHREIVYAPGRSRWEWVTDPDGASKLAAVWAHAEQSFANAEAEAADLPG